jgi:hypothetical protein
MLRKTVALASQTEGSEAAQKQVSATIESAKAQLEWARYYLDNTLTVRKAASAL